MGGGGKSASGGGYGYDYYGTIAGVIRCGPIDTIDTLLVDGQILWQGPVNRTDPGMTNPYTLTLTDPTRIGSGGYVNLYWGDDTQIANDPALVGHPPYRGFAYIVLKNFLFGRERTTAPNIEIVARYLPRPPETVIAGTDWDNPNSVNPWAVLAELMTSIHGMALPAAKLDAASWQAAHDYVKGATDRRLLGYCAPLLTSQEQMQQFCNEMLGLVDGGLRVKADGTIEAFYYPVDPGDLSQYTTLNANDLTAEPQVTFDAWDAVPTGVIVQYVDGAQWWVDWAVPTDDLRALQQADEPRRQTLQLPWVIRYDQAKKIGAEWCKRNCQPQISGSIQVRPERAVNPDGSPLRVGNRFLLDVQPEPGGAGMLQLCRVVDRKFKATGPVTIDLQGEVIQPVIPYTPSFTPPGGEEITVAALSAARIVPMPFILSGGIPAVGALAARGDDLTIGAHMLFDVAGGAGTFTQLGDQIRFAVPCELGADYADDATGAIRVTITDTRDEAIALQQPGDSGAQNDELLLVVYKTDGDYIASNADGTPNMEWFSIDSSALVAGNTYDFTVLRARLGSLAAAWNNGDTAWIIPRASLVVFTHNNFPDYVKNATNLVFRLSPFSKFAEYDGAPTNLAFAFPAAWQKAPQITWTTPATSSYALPGTGNLTPDATITDSDQNLIRLTLYHVREDTGVQTTVFDVPFAKSGSKTLADGFALANVATPINFPGQVAVDTYYTLTIRAQDASGNIVESRRSLVRLATGGGGGSLLAPTLNPDPSDYPMNSPLAVTLNAVAPATEIDYFITFYGGALPAGAPSVVMATSVVLHLSSSKRIWARSGNAGNYSAWVFGDYLKASNY